VSKDGTIMQEYLTSNTLSFVSCAHVSHVTQFP